MKRIFFLAVLAALAFPAASDAGPIRDRLSKLFRPAPKAVAVTPAAKPMPKAATGGKVPTCCCQTCVCNTAKK